MWTSESSLLSRLPVCGLQVCRSSGCIFFVKFKFYKLYKFQGVTFSLHTKKPDILAYHNHTFEVMKFEVNNTDPGINIETENLVPVSNVKPDTTFATKDPVIIIKTDSTEKDPVIPQDIDGTKKHKEPLIIIEKNATEKEQVMSQDTDATEETKEPVIVIQTDATEKCPVIPQDTDVTEENKEPVIIKETDATERVRHPTIYTQTVPPADALIQAMYKKLPNQQYKVENMFLAKILQEATNIDLPDDKLVPFEDFCEAEIANSGQLFSCIEVCEKGDYNTKKKNPEEAEPHIKIPGQNDRGECHSSTLKARMFTKKNMEWKVASQKYPCYIPNLKRKKPQKVRFKKNIYF